MTFTVIPTCKPNYLSFLQVFLKNSKLKYSLLAVNNNTLFIRKMGSIAVSTERPIKKPRLDEKIELHLEENKDISLVQLAQTKVKKWKKTKSSKRYRELDVSSPEMILLADIQDTLTSLNISYHEIHTDVNAYNKYYHSIKPTKSKKTADDVGNENKLPSISQFREVDLEIYGITASGEGIGILNHCEKKETEHESVRPPGVGKKEVVLVPFALPGEIIRAKIYFVDEFYSKADFLEVIKKSSIRNDSLIKCKYFKKCSGCQYQMISYKGQLELKKAVIERAYKHLCSFEVDIKLKDRLPNISDCHGSPIQYGYRTKITPHFNLPRKYIYKEGDARPPLGFQQKGRNCVIDIEECPIATETVQKGLETARETFQTDFKKYKAGATINLREAATNITYDDSKENANRKIKSFEKICKNDPRDLMEEVVDGKYVFEFPSGAFFQNNNAILGPLTTYVRNNLDAPKNLVDTYCGSGLFAITCSSGADNVLGVDVDAGSIKSASENAKRNNIKNATFISGDADKIFGKLTNIDADNTAVIIDPPRRGSDESFLKQLLDFSPKRIVYVSCNVHSQARDLRYFLTQDSGMAYKVESITGFDLFPQTHHIESVAVLSR